MPVYYITDIKVRESDAYWLIIGDTSSESDPKSETIYAEEYFIPSIGTLIQVGFSRKVKEALWGIYSGDKKYFTRDAIMKQFDSFAALHEDHCQQQIELIRQVTLISKLYKFKNKFKNMTFWQRLKFLFKPKLYLERGKND